MPTRRTWIGLIRGIGPLTHKKMSMSDLRVGCEEAGLENVRTILATGNIIFDSDLPASSVSGILTDILKSYNLDNEIFLRSPQDLRLVLDFAPFPDAISSRPNRLLVLFLGKRLSASSSKKIFCGEGDSSTRVEMRGSELYLDYVDGVSNSKRTPAYFEKLLGCSGTARNWNTVRKLVEATSG